ncbi:MAG TPA: N-6 DNA methylase [Blastocatellia bacterium]|nr:N-6 DNA methylase [Blastocatellia bacterium]
MAKTKDDRHRYGQHYTPPEVARLLAAFAVRSANDLVLDPSCGDGRLLDQSLQIKRHLGRRDKRSADLLAQEVFGIDRSAVAVKLASRAGARAITADFFDVEPGASFNESARLPSSFDAVIGNPPYIRQEVMGARDKRRIEARLESDRNSSPEIHWPRWSGRSDIYVYFFARSIRFLKAGGRLVFLTASSWLDAGYGAALREFLLNNFRVIAIIESARESFFADASINTNITVLAREADPERREATPARFVQLLEPLGGVLKSDGDAIGLARSIERIDSSVATGAYRVRIMNQADLMSGPNRAPSNAGQGWGKYLRADDVFFRVLERGSARMLKLGQLARVRFGVKTGANEFFYVKGRRESQKSNVKKREAKTGLLALGDVASVRRGLTTGANEFFYLSRVKQRAADITVVESMSGFRHAIESQYLSPVVFSLKEISGILLKRDAPRKLFFNCPVAREDLAGTKALDYIRSGERAGFNDRPSCAARGQWYQAARGMKPAPLIFPSKVGERWLVALNRARVFEDKKLYGIFPRRGVSKLLLAALLNSTWARYYAEITCRQMTGAQAIADIDVRVAERIMIPDPRELPGRIKRRIQSALASIARRPVLSVFEEVKRADRRRLDELTLAAIGFANAAERKATLDELYEAVTKLVRARIDRT